MSELAFNINGEAFEVPANATGWRVRRMRAKGSPEVVYGRDGLPLVLPIDAELEDLKSEVSTMGRYRLDLVDQSNKAINDVPSGYVQVNPDAPPPSPTVGSGLSKPSDNLFVEAMRTQAAMALAVIERFPQMMDSAANLLRAADGAGLPARQPRVVEYDDDDSDDDDHDVAAPAGFDLNALIPQIAPLLMALFNKKDLGAMLDWRKAAPKGEKRIAKPAKAIASEETTSSVPENATAIIPPIDAETMTHFIAIQSALKPEEAALAREVAGNLSATELHAWFDELKKLTVPQAVQKIRTLVAGNTEAVP